MVKKIYFVDLDGVVVEHNYVLKPNALENLRQKATDGEIWLFSCWAFCQRDIEFIASWGIPIAGIIRKPLADKYVYIDDKLSISECANSL